MSITPQTVDGWIAAAASLIGLIAQVARWGGGAKLSRELERVAGEVNAFRTDPVLKAEIDALKSGHVW